MIDDLTLREIENIDSLSEEVVVQILKTNSNAREQLLQLLDDRKSIIINRRFPDDSDDVPTLREVGLELNLNKQRVKVLQDQALNSLRKTLIHNEYLRRFLASGEKDLSVVPVTALLLSTKTRFGVEKLGCLTLQDITKKSQDDFLSMRYFGETNLQELMEQMEIFGVGIAG